MKTLKHAASLAAALLIAGCTSAVQEPTNSVPAGMSHDQVKGAILLAGYHNKWEMHETLPGIIHGVLTVEYMRGEVHIDYDETKYTIRYYHSANMDYSDGDIDTDYNDWVNNLNNSIHTYLTDPALSEKIDAVVAEINAEAAKTAPVEPYNPRSHINLSGLDSAPPPADNDLAMPDIETVPATQE